tara:strand:+ start:218 stop:487 length:270 start_codon:yes stop_codon:yes gene_type:complete
MRKCLTIIGTSPQLITASVGYKAISSDNSLIDDIVHAAQHFYAELIEMRAGKATIANTSKRNHSQVVECNGKLYDGGVIVTLEQLKKGL